MRLAINERHCLLYNEQTGQTLTPTALSLVVAKANAYPALVEFVKSIAKTDRNKSSGKAKELLRSLGEPV